MASVLHSEVDTLVNLEAWVSWAGGGSDRGDLLAQSLASSLRTLQYRDKNSTI